MGNQQCRLTARFSGGPATPDLAQRARGPSAGTNVGPQPKHQTPKTTNTAYDGETWLTGPKHPTTATLSSCGFGELASGRIPRSLVFMDTNR